jgi:hypothetical protein
MFVPGIRDRRGMAAVTGATMIVAGAVLISGDDPQVLTVDTVFAGLVLVVLGAIGLVLAFLLWATEINTPPRGEQREPDQVGHTRGRVPGAIPGSEPTRR